MPNQIMPNQIMPNQTKTIQTKSCQTKPSKNQNQPNQSNPIQSKPNQTKINQTKAIHSKPKSQPKPKTTQIFIWICFSHKVDQVPKNNPFLKPLRPNDDRCWILKGFGGILSRLDSAKKFEFLRTFSKATEKTIFLCISFTLNWKKKFGDNTWQCFAFTSQVQAEIQMLTTSCQILTRFHKGLLNPLKLLFDFLQIHTGRNCFNLLQISFSANTTDKDQGVSGVSRDQKNCEKSKTTHCHVKHSPIIE